MGAITPLGNTVTEYWDGLVKGVSGADYINNLMFQNLKPGLPARLKILNPLNYLEKKKPEKLTAYTQFALVAS